MKPPKRRGRKPTGTALTNTERSRLHRERARQAHASEQEELVALRDEVASLRTEAKTLRAQNESYRLRIEREEQQARAAQAVGSLADSVPGFERSILSKVASQRKATESAVAQALLVGILPCLVPTVTAEARTARIAALLKQYTLR